VVVETKVVDFLFGELLFGRGASGCADGTATSSTAESLIAFTFGAIARRKVVWSKANWKHHVDL
jgi:hypothetical protein